MNDLTYIHRLSTDKEIKLTVKRENGQIPKFSSSLDVSGLTDQDINEYLDWRMSISREMLKELSKEEVRQMANYVLGL